MIAGKINFNSVPFLSKKDVSYQTNFDAWTDLAKWSPDIESFSKIIEYRSNKPIDRALLVEVIEDQYSQLNVHESVNKNIKLLKNDNCFTIVTAHQPSLLTGPLYYIYKISSIINLCKTLKERYSDYDFVPVFVSGGEDHDFDEINHLTVFNQKYTWERGHDREPVGRLSTEGIQDVISSLKEKFKADGDPSEFLDEVLKASSSSRSYGELVKAYTNRLFEKHGLVCLSMDDKKLKGSFTQLIKKEVFEQVSVSKVQETQSFIEQKGFKSQAFARDINFFYITEENKRCRIEYTDNQFHIIDSSLSFSREEFEGLIDSHPERFSPNVVMRPIYQEYCLPNLAYVGGGGELAYWLERKSQFELFDVSFPILVRRNSVYLLDRSVKRNIGKLDMDVRSFFDDEHQIIMNYLAENETEEIDLNAEKDLLKNCFEALKAKVSLYDKSLSGRIEADLAKNIKSFDQLESRLRKALKDKHQVNIDRIKSVYTKIFPYASLQERKINMLEFVQLFGMSIIDKLIDLLDPMDKHFLIIDFTEES